MVYIYIYINLAIWRILGFFAGKQKVIRRESEQFQKRIKKQNKFAGKPNVKVRRAQTFDYAGQYLSAVAAQWKKESIVELPNYTMLKKSKKTFFENLLFFFGEIIK